MTFDVYFPFRNKDDILTPGIKPTRMEWADIYKLCGSPEQQKRIEAVRNAKTSEEKAEAKKALPAICITGYSSQTRAARYMKPTGLFMIDIDHCEDPSGAWVDIYMKMGKAFVDTNILFAHVTVSGKGLRLAVRAQQGIRDLAENMDWLNKKFDLFKYGDVDEACKDFSRISFLPTEKDFLYQNADLALSGEGRWDGGTLDNDWREDPKKPASGEMFSEDETIDNFTEEEVAEFEGYDYKGTLLKTIIEKWVEVKGSPGKGEIHNYYNDMVKNFRNIMSNNKRALLYLLPRFGHTASECWSSIQSICRVNTLSELPRPFYFFLKDNGFLKSRVPTTGSLAEYMMADADTQAQTEMPWLPPVFREYMRIAPKDFRASTVNALLPVMGTLASYLQAPYYYDGRMHTPSFFSIIYAPAGTGKGFVGRIVDVLFDQLTIRDYVQQARENIYLNTLSRKGANEKAPEDPHTTLRIIPPKNSEAEFLQKMKDNCGYHMFTYAAEMDSWAKGVRAAGGNKDDMIRVAWDNDEYGQQFKSANTFKGKVRLYWNVLITGTIQQLMAYFKNVENGLITRCSFTTIDNQEFAEAPIWKALNKKDKEAIKKFMERCDRNTYEEPCELLPSDVDSVSAEKFDEEIKWRFTYRKRQTVDMEWLRETIDEFLEDHRKKAAADFDRARDVFRRRVAVRGFRLGLICHALWDKPRQADLNKCIPFIKWWMEQDIEGSLKLWGQRYNNEVQDGPVVPQRSLFNEMPQAFTKTDVYTKCVQMGIKSPIRNILCVWQKIGVIKQLRKNEYEKTNQRKNEDKR